MKKRQRPPQILDAVVSRRKRVLNEEEIELWHSVAKQTRPLRNNARVAKPHAAAEPAPVAKKVATSTKPEHPAHPAHLVKIVRPDVRPSPPPLAPLGRRERSQLSRGRKDIDARLDLHGMTQIRAHRALLNFLQRANHEGMTFVLVITGKGRTVGAESERGVLRRQVPEWLGLAEFRTLVVGFEEAHIGHGGEGALYVRVRRAR
jgi:DNA-nicking Smr family endonuclease